MKAGLFAVALIAFPPMLAPVPAAAQSGERIKRVIVYGREACPRGTGDEVVICGRRPERERYRIPEELREPSDNPENESWAVRARSLEYVGRTGTQSCSTVGPGGFTGCWEQMMRQAREERRQAGSQPHP